jgi:acyl-CoA oxidase
MLSPQLVHRENYSDGFYLNVNAFLVTIELLGDSKQAGFWRDEVLSGRVVGGYGQTEIGHGSNVKGL